MADLHDHFGEDASLPPAAAAEVAAFLQTYAAEAGTRRPRGFYPMSRPPIRCASRRRPSGSAATVVSLRNLRRADDEAKSNCVACHRDADSGRFDAQAIVRP